MAMLREVAWSPGDRPLAYVCGPTRLVETVASTLVTLVLIPVAYVSAHRLGERVRSIDWSFGRRFGSLVGPARTQQ